MILIYAFSNQWGTNISHRTLLELQKTIKGENFDFRLIRFDFKSFFQKYISRNQYDLIIGLGDTYSDFNKIRIETQAKNAYNNETIYPFSPILLDLNLPNLDNFDSNYFAISSRMGTYNCNWIAYSIQLYINQKHPETNQIFLHLPKRSNATLLASQIKTLLELNNLI
jgi:pyrrolidone-carboxylate peptidase